MSDNQSIVKKGRSRSTGHTQIYHDLYDIYSELIGGAEGLGYYGYLKRLVNNDSESDFVGYAFPGKKFLSKKLKLGTDKIKEIELKCLIWGLTDIDVEKQWKGTQSNATKFLYIINDPETKKDFFNKVDSGELPRDINQFKELLPTGKTAKKTIENVIKTHELLADIRGSYLDRNDIKSYPNRNDSYPDKNEVVPTQECKKVLEEEEAFNIFLSLSDPTGNDFEKYILKIIKGYGLEEERADIITEFINSYLNKIKKDGICYNPYKLFEAIIKNYKARKLIHSLGKYTVRGEILGEEEGINGFKELEDIAKNTYEE
ncbi:MAG: hypothetical protein ACM3UU_02950 [Ignavibacteriales bacterium]